MKFGLLKFLLKIFYFLNNRTFYGINENFPFSQLMIRSEKLTKIYFISSGIYEIFQEDKNKNLKV